MDNVWLGIRFRGGEEDWAPLYNESGWMLADAAYDVLRDMQVASGLTASEIEEIGCPEYEQVIGAALEAVNSGQQSGSVTTRLGDCAWRVKEYAE